jgi:hypothetical protein
MLSRSARAVLDTALQKYRPGRSEPILVGGIAQLKPALRLMAAYRLVIQEVEGAEVLTSYTRWLESMRLKEGENQEVYVAFSPRFERISKRRDGVHLARAQSERLRPEHFSNVPIQDTVRHTRHAARRAFQLRFDIRPVIPEPIVDFQDRVKRELVTPTRSIAK